MLLFVKLLTGRMLNVDVEPAETVADLKAKITAKTDIPVRACIVVLHVLRTCSPTLGADQETLCNDQEENQRLIYAGHAMNEDDRKMSDCKVTPCLGSCIGVDLIVVTPHRTPRQCSQGEYHSLGHGTSGRLLVLFTRTP